MDGPLWFLWVDGTFCFLAYLHAELYKICQNRITELRGVFIVTTFCHISVSEGNCSFITAVRFAFYILGL